MRKRGKIYEVFEVSSGKRGDDRIEERRQELS